MPAQPMLFPSFSEEKKISVVAVAQLLKITKIKNPLAPVHIRDF
jgi:hypothetical protein